MDITERNRDITTLEQQLLSESVAMAKYAHSNGKTVPEGITEGLNELLIIRQHALVQQDDNTQDNAAIGKALSNNPPSKIIVRQLANIHSRLTQIVAPATPGAILYLSKNAEKGGLLRFLGPVELIKRLMLISVFFLLLFMFVSQTQYVSPEILASDDIFNKTGLNLLMVMLFYMSAAGIGACFAALYQANRYVAEGSYDPKYEPSYWSRLALGIIAGLIISILVPLDAAIDAGENKSHVAAWIMLAKPTLAMLGGFSSALVYRVLSRLVEAVESLVRAEMREELAQHKKALESQFDELATQHRMEAIARLVKLQQKLSEGESSEEIKQRLAGMLDELFPGELKTVEVEAKS